MTSRELNSALIAKYNVPGPRYTSYPTVPHWDERSFSIQGWNETLQRSFAESNDSDGISLYVHLPYCESLCTFCGCNKRITKKHEVEAPYIETLLREWASYRQLLGGTPRIRELHLGGGTPTFFNPENLGILIEGLTDGASTCGSFEFSFEAHPNNTTPAHLQTLYDRGFTRLSLGVQDFDSRVQEVINRVQPFERVHAVTEAARETGYTSINYDLIYGLPFQTKSSVSDTIRRVLTLRPDRIAYYSYAHVPWIKGVGQRKFSEADLPRDGEKRALYEISREMFEDAGYHEIGMDHFALTDDSLYVAATNHQLHRNFMGYTAAHTQLSIGLGVSSISDSWYGFAQNEKTVEDYIRRVNEGHIPIFRGHLLTDEDLVLRGHILNIMCRFTTSWESERAQCPALYQGLERLKEMESDELVDLTGDQLRVTELGKPFLRNICMALDARLWQEASAPLLFSQVI